MLASTGAFAEPVIGEQVAHVQFKFDSSRLLPGVEANLATVAKEARANPDEHVVLGGFTDPIGSAPYNVGLAIRRAKAVESALVDQGVRPDQIVISSFGEAGPRLAGYAPNRRVTITLSDRPVGAAIDQTFAEGGTSVTWGRPMTTAEIEGSAGIPVASR